MESNDFYQSDEQYIQDTFLDENGRPISPRKARHLLTWFMAGCFVLSAVMLILLFYILHSRGQKYDRCSVEVVGVVVDNVRNGSSENSVVFPVFRYEYNGRTYTQQAQSGDYPAQYGIGEHRTIHINPNDPSEYYTEKDDSSAVTALVLLASVFAALGVMMIVVIVKSKRNEQNTR